MSKHPIRILSNMARAGGTLVSKCLGAMDNIVLLSEIHPLGTHIFNPIEQAQDWYNLFDENMDKGNLSFLNTIQLIEKRCSRNNKTLVLRDWAHLDFIGVPFIRNPGFRLQLTESLSPHFDIIQYAIVRHPIDQWTSTCRLKIMQGLLDLDTFLTGYRRFAEQSSVTGFMRYEDFTRDPVHHLKELCRHLQLDFDAHFINRWHENSRVTGDTSKQSRGSQIKVIRPLKQRTIDNSVLKRFLNNPDYWRAIELLGYVSPQPTP